MIHELVQVLMQLWNCFVCQEKTHWAQRFEKYFCNTTEIKENIADLTTSLFIEFSNKHCDKNIYCHLLSTFHSRVYDRRLSLRSLIFRPQIQKRLA